MRFDLPHSALLVQPGLKHEHIPEVIVPVACAGEMFAPLLTYGIGIEDASIAPAAPSKCPVADLVDDMVTLPAASPIIRSTAPNSMTSAIVDVPWALM